MPGFNFIAAQQQCPNNERKLQLKICLTIKIMKQKPYYKLKFLPSTAEKYLISELP